VTVQRSLARLSIDDFVLTRGPARHPRALAIEARGRELAEAAGLLDEQNAARFAAFNSVATYVHAYAEPERVVTCAEFYNWLFFFDDLHDEHLELAADRARLERAIAGYVQSLLTGKAEDSALSRYLVDFRERALALTGPAWLRRFVRSFEDYLYKGSLVAAVNFASGTIPRLEPYLRQREYDGAVHLAFDLLELAAGVKFPESALESEVTRELRRAWARTISNFNDIVSYPKEVLVHNNPNNLVHVLENEHQCSREEACRLAARIVNRDANRVLELAEPFVAQGSSAPEASDALARVREALFHWQRGNISWSFDGVRYASPDSPFVELARPRG
jgi:5-epi-alpha-selinene synthase